MYFSGMTVTGRPLLHHFTFLYWHLFYEMAVNRRPKHAEGSNRSNV